MQRRMVWNAPGAFAFATSLLVAAVSLMTGREPLLADPPPPAPATSETSRAGFFEARVRPLLIEKCQPCHNATVQQGNVRMDRREDVLKTLVAGKPSESALVQVVHYTGKVKMPPTGKLPAQDIATLEKWVREGAYWSADTVRPKSAAGNIPNPTYWSFRPVARHLEPPVEKSGIDAFILARLQKNGLTFSPRADRTTLLRRLSFDLTGLPPTPAEMNAFLADTAPDAYVRVVDRLLASPRFGERWARHWLDVARYADSNGLDENLAHGNAWRYRDWVIEAINRDLPYDQFIQQQIAGDLMPTEDEVENNRRITATGYLTLGAKVLAEQDKPKLVMDIVDEQIDVVSKSVMGLTISCARCHDHKFDPISTKDYYALAGIFKSTKTMANLDFVSRWNERPVPTTVLTREIARYESEIVKPLVEKEKAKREAAVQQVRERLMQQAPDYVATALQYSRQPLALIVLDGRDVPGKQVVEAETFVRGNALKNFDTYGKDIGVIHTGASPTVAEWDITVPRAGRYQLDVRYSAEESRPVILHVNGEKVLDNALGSVTGSWNPDTQRWETLTAITLRAGTNILKLERAGAIPHVDKLALAPLPDVAPGTPAPKSPEELAREKNLDAAVLRKVVALIHPAGEVNAGVTQLKNAPEFVALAQEERLFRKEDADAIKAAGEDVKKAREAAPRIPSVMAVAEQPKPENVRVHIRGSTENLGEMVPRGFPRVLAKAGEESVPDDAGSGRLRLARWLTRPDHPLTARVAVNRVWQHLFGVGLVTTPDNWGLRGARPSHPELLDWLAQTFVENDRWSLKRLIRRIVLSDTYRQTSALRSPLALQKDPDNRLLWRQNLRRLEAEPIRDAILTVAGTLDEKSGGTLLTAANGDYVTNDQSGNAAQYEAPRRSIYLPVIRNAVFDFFQTFDFGDPSMVNAHRASTTVAPQALYLLNSGMVREQSRAFAGTLLTGQKTNEARIKAAIQRAFARPATADDIRRGQTFVAQADALLATPASGYPLPDPEKRRAAVWAAYCQILFASNEFVYVR